MQMLALKDWVQKISDWVSERQKQQTSFGCFFFFKNPTHR